MPDSIRHPDIVPTKVGNHLKDWVPVFTGAGPRRNDDFFGNCWFINRLYLEEKENGDKKF
jgi:hypothetical protein